MIGFRRFRETRATKVKICDTCQRQYADSLQYCLQDGTVLSLLKDPQATLRLEARPTNTKVRTERKAAWGLFAFVGIGLIGVTCILALGVTFYWLGKGSDSTASRYSDQPTRTSQPNSNPVANRADAERDLDQINSDVGFALVHNDVAKLDRLLADDYRYVGDAGVTLTKADVLTLYNTGNLNYDYLTTSDPKVEVASDLTKGTVTGHAKSKGRLRGLPFTDSYFYRNSFEKRDGHWQLVNGVSWH